MEQQPDVLELEEYPVPGPAPLPEPEISREPERASRRAGLAVLAAGLLLIGLNLRIGVASIGPVIPDIRASLGLSAATASLMTTIPVFAFGVFAFFTPSLSRRIGLHRLLGAALAVLVVGILLRLEPAPLPLFAGTILVGAAIAVGNVAMPPAIKEDFARHAGLMMGLYSTMLFVGAALASGMTVPLRDGLGGSWRAALAMGAVPALIALVVWIPQLLRSPGRARSGGSVADAADEHGEPSFRGILTDPVALAVTALMGLQSMSYYAALTWVPTMLTDAGMDAGLAGGLLSYSAFPGILASLVMPALARRARRSWTPPVIATALTALAFLGLALAPAPFGAAAVWMTLMGLGQGAAISLSLSCIVWRSPDTRHTGHVSTMAQGFGYLLAGLGPIGLGALHAATGSWTLPLAVLLALLVCQGNAGVLACRPRLIGVRAMVGADGA
jgi:CP family cyanate transporter-like MFS transporter